MLTKRNTKNRTSCSVYGCLRNARDADISMLTLPADCELRNEWLKRIGRPDLLKKKKLIPASHRVCSIHFESSMLSTQIVRKLLPGAIPTKFLKDPESSTSKYENDSENTNISADLTTQTKNSMDFQEAYLKMLATDTTNTACMTTAGTQTDNSTTDQTTQTSLSSNTPRIKELRVRLHDFQEPEKKRMKLQNELSKIKHEIEGNKSLSLVPSDDEDDETTKRFYKLVKWQNSVRNINKGILGAEFKLFALNLHYSSPQTYRSLRRILKLPSESTLSRFKLHIRPEIDDRIFNVIASKLESLPDKAKYCTVCVDEVVLKRNLYYDIKHDVIFGLHNINGNVTKDIGLNAYVIILQGIAVNWKVPIGYSFLASTKHYQQLDEWINAVISKLLKMGIKVKAVVSDQGSNFDKYAKEIKQVTPEKPYFNCNGSKIYYIFDVPDMLKCVRNYLLTNDFYLAGQKISWDYIRRMYLQQKEHNLHLIPKVTDAHINPDKFQKMCVKHGADIFNERVYGALNTFIYTTLLPKDAKPTAEFIKTMTDVCDVMNSSKIESFDSNRNVLETAQKMFEKITLSNEKTKSIKIFENFQITIQAIMMICNDLKEEGVKYILRGRFNKDPLEKFLDSVRQKSGNCWKPTAIQFTKAFSKLFVCNMLTNSSAANCRSDLCKLLSKADTILNDTEAKQDPSTGTETSSAVSLDGEVDYRFELPTENAIAYVSGYLLFKCSQKHRCYKFDTYLKNTPDLKDTWMFVYYKELNTQWSFYECLKVPLDSFVNYVQHLETTFLNNFVKVQNHPGKTLLNLLKDITFNPPCPCFPSLYLLKLFVRFRIFSTIKYNNRRLKDGNRSKYIEVQPL